MMIITNEVKDLEIILDHSNILRYIFSTKTNYYIWKESIYNVLENWESYDEVALANYLFEYPYKEKKVICNRPTFLTFSNRIKGYKVERNYNGQK